MSNFEDLWGEAFTQAFEAPKKEEKKNTKKSSDANAISFLDGKVTVVSLLFCNEEFMEKDFAGTAKKDELISRFVANTSAKEYEGGTITLTSPGIYFIVPNFTLWERVYDVPSEPFEFRYGSVSFKSDEKKEAEEPREAEQLEEDAEDENEEAESAPVKKSESKESDELKKLLLHAVSVYPYLTGDKCRFYYNKASKILSVKPMAEFKGLKGMVTIKTPNGNLCMPDTDNKLETPLLMELHRNYPYIPQYPSGIRLVTEGNEAFLVPAPLEPIANAGGTAPSGKKKELFPTNAKLSIGYAEYDLSPSDFNGKNEVEAKALFDFLRNNGHVQFTTEKSEAEFFKETNTIFVQRNGSRKG